MVVGYNVGLEALLQQDISEPVFYGGKIKRVVGKPSFGERFGA